jgi:hypothetical protein
MNTTSNTTVAIDFYRLEIRKNSEVAIIRLPSDRTSLDRPKTKTETVVLTISVSVSHRDSF